MTVFVDGQVLTADQLLAAFSEKVGTSALAAYGSSPGASLVGFDGEFLTDFFKQKLGRIVGSISELRGLDKTKYTQVLLVGYTTAGDVPLRHFYLKSSGTENGITTIVAADGGVWEWTPEGEIDVRFGGADSTGVSDSTTAAQAVLNSGAAEVFIPAGTWLLGQLTVPAGVRRIRGAGIGKTIINATGTISGAGLLNLSSLSNVEICGMTINMPAASFPSGWGIALASCTDCYIHDIAIPQAPAAGVRGSDCTGVTVERVSVINWTTIGIAFAGVNNRITVDSCYVPGTLTQTSHNIQVIGGSGHKITRNYTTNNVAGSFGANLYNAANSLIANNIHYGGLAEGYNVHNVSNTSLLGNVVIYTGSAADFGMSVYGDNVSGGKCQNVSVSGNVIYGSGKAGVALAAYCNNCSVRVNTIYNPNRLNEAQWGGVTLYGFGCNGNYAGDNFIYSDDGKVKYAANEWNDGTGNPDFNILKDNAVITSGTLTAEIALTGTSSQAYMMMWASFTPTVSASSGSITSYTVNAATYLTRGKHVTVRFDISISNAGTGSGGLTVLWPGVPNAKTKSGLIQGREDGVSGKFCGGLANGGGVVINDYSNASIIATGARAVCNGVFEAA